MKYTKLFVQSQEYHMLQIIWYLNQPLLTELSLMVTCIQRLGYRYTSLSDILMFEKRNNVLHALMAENWLGQIQCL